MEYSVIIFDTAPTGHTLRFLSFPAALQKGFGKFFNLKSKFGALFSQVLTLFSFSPLSPLSLSRPRALTLSHSCVLVLSQFRALTLAFRALTLSHSPLLWFFCFFFFFFFCFFVFCFFGFCFFCFFCFFLLLLNIVFCSFFFNTKYQNKFIFN
jgi:Anion-transporting ATPase